MTTEDDIVEAELFSDGGPALSRKTAGRLARQLRDTLRQLGAARGEAQFHRDRTVYLERCVGELERAVREAVDWMMDPGVSTFSQERYERWLDALGMED